jgi:type I restriction enzyme R subunit
MSKLLDEIIAARKANAIEYEECLKKLAELAKKVQKAYEEATPASLNTPGRRALYNNLGRDEAPALKIDTAVKTGRPHDLIGGRSHPRPRTARQGHSR